MKSPLQQIIRRIDALASRERAILLLMIFAIALFVIKLSVFDPQMKQKTDLQARLQQVEKEMAEAQASMNQRMQVLGIDPDAEIKKRIADMKSHLARMDADFGGLQKNLVAPAKIDRLLADILQRNKRLQLISLHSLPVVNLMAIPNSEEKSEQADTHSIFKHEVELVLQGNYLDMLAYMRELEAMPERLYWGRSQLQVLEYPKAQLNLNVFTLSLEKKWLHL